MDYVGAVLDDSSGKIHRLKVSISLCFTSWLMLRHRSKHFIMMLHTISFLQRIMSKSTAGCVMRWSLKSILFFVQEQPIKTLKVCAQYVTSMCQCVTSMCQNSRVFLLMLTNILLADKQKALKIIRRWSWKDGYKWKKISGGRWSMQMIPLKRCASTSQRDILIYRHSSPVLWGLHWKRLSCSATFLSQFGFGIFVSRTKINVLSLIPYSLRVHMK